MKKIFSLLAAVLFAGSMMAANVVKATLDFTDNTAWKFPVGSTAGITTDSAYSDGTYTIRLAATTKYYFNTDGYLLFGKSGSTLTLPAFDFDVTKIVVTGREGASGSTKQNIFVGENAVSTETTGAQVANEYAIASNYQAAGNVYVLKVTSAHNTQVTKIEIYGEGEPSVEPGDEPVAEAVLFKAENVEADAETSVVAASAVLVDNDLLKVENVYESFLSGTSHTYEATPDHSIEFQKALQVRASSYPAGEDLIGGNNNSASTADNKKASPLVLTAKEDVEVVFYYRRQSSNTVYEVEGDKNSPIVSVKHDQNDSKDLIVYDQADIATMMLAENYALIDAANEEYAFAVKQISFKKGHVYTLTAKGTTLPLFGFEYAAAEPEAPVLPDVLNVAEAIAAATATPAQIVKDDSIAVRGVVNKIEFKGSNFATYGSVTIYATDATGAEGTFTFYNCYSLEADTFRTSNPAFDASNKNNAFFNSVTDGNGVSVWVGDTVIAEGKYNYYAKNAAHQLNQGCYLTEIIAGPRVEPAAGVDPEPIEGAITVAKAIELVNAMKDGATSTHEFTVEGYVVNAEEFSWSSLSQLFFLADDAENSGNQVFEAYYCTGMENGQAIPLINGDKVQLTGKLQKFVKGTDMTPEISNAPAVIIEKAAGERPATPTIIEKTVAEALEIGKTVENNALTADYYSITGYITAFAGTDGSFWMADAADGGKDKTTAFEVYKPSTEATLQVGDKVNVITRIKNYSQTIESETSAIVTVVEALKIDTVNVATAVSLALQLEDNAASAKNYVVIGNVAKIATAYSEKDHNISFFMTDDAVSAEAYGDLKVYRGNIDEAAGKALAPGDRVMVVGKLKNNFYNDANSAQMNAGSEVTVLWKQALEQIVLTEKVNKVIMDGVIYIVRDGKLYNLQGAQVR